MKTSNYNEPQLDKLTAALTLTLGQFNNGSDRAVNKKRIYINVTKYEEPT